MRRLLFVVLLACSAGQANLPVPPGSPELGQSDLSDDCMVLYIPDRRTMPFRDDSDRAEEFACVAKDFYYDIVRFRLNKLEARTELFRRCNAVYEKLQQEGRL